MATERATAATPRLWPATDTGRLLAILALGLMARLLLVLLTTGHGDPGVFTRVVAAFADREPFDAYAANPGGPIYQSYPYPPGGLPLLAILWQLAGDGQPDLAGSIQTFKDYLRIAVSLADLALAALVYRVLRDRFDAAAGLGGAALLALGPVPILISGYMGQLESLALLPAVLGVLLIAGESARQRPVLGGLLLGLGAAVKTYPALLWPATVSRVRDRGRLVAAVVGGAVAAGVLVLSIAPFVLDYGGTLDTMLGYGGSPGLGGISMAVMPDVPLNWTGRASGTLPLQGSEATLQRTLLLLGLAITSVVAWRRRLSATDAMAALLLAQTLWGYTWFPQYSWWPVLALALAGWLRSCAVVQLLFLPPLLILFRYESFGPGHIGEAGIALFWFPPMIGAYAVVTWCWLRLLGVLPPVGELRASLSAAMPASSRGRSTGSPRP